jgi:hypothetical protein
MPEQTIIAWDLETIRDLEAAARMLNLSNATDAEIRRALGDGFPKHPLHKIACINPIVGSVRKLGGTANGWGFLARFGSGRF